jgi:hypothetical protein
MIAHYPLTINKVIITPTKMDSKTNQQLNHAVIKIIAKVLPSEDFDNSAG